MLDEPQKSFSDLWLWRAFDELSACRNIGFAFERIKHSEIEAYARLQGFDEDETWHLYVVVVAMDQVLAEHIAKERASGE